MVTHHHKGWLEASGTRDPSSQMVERFKGHILQIDKHLCVSRAINLNHTGSNIPDWG